MTDTPIDPDDDDVGPSRGRGQRPPRRPRDDAGGRRPPRPPAGEHTAEGDEPQLQFASVYEFVDRHLIQVYARDLSNTRDITWCPRWKDHTEAVDRLEALYRAWEHLRIDGGTGMSTWWIEHADRQMAALMNPQGTFAGCSIRGHHPKVEPLPTEATGDAVHDQLMTGDDPNADDSHDDGETDELDDVEDLDIDDL